jgi:ubiquinone/menaquinone biosynthesis C-methylase UbiE
MQTTVEDMLRHAKDATGFGSQFAHPRGLLGRFAGVILATTAKERSRWVRSLLDLQRDDRVLEVGFGPGMDIQRVSAIAMDGFVASIDPSDVMVLQASARNAAAIRIGTVELRRASMDEPLPYPDAPFTKVFAINSWPFWERPADGLRELRRVLRPGGTIAIAVQPVMRSVSDALVRATGTGWRNR